MKSISLFSAAAFALPLFFAVNSASAAPSAKSLNLQMKCELIRRYLDKDGNAVRADHTPASVKPVPVAVSDLSSPSGGTIAEAKLAYTASTPDGMMEVTGSATAMDSFGTAVRYTIMQTVYLPIHQILAREPSAFGPSFKYSDPNSTFEHESVLNLNFGRTADGYSINEYYAVCTVAPTR